MPTLTLKNVPQKLYALLKRSAAVHRRSINRKAIVHLESALTTRRFDPAAFLADVRALRSALGDIHLTDADLRQAKNQGRP